MGVVVMEPTPWSDLPAGAQLGNLEYTVDGSTLAEYRALVGDGGHYPNLLADDCRALLMQRCGPLPVATRWRRLELLRPPVLGRRVQVGGWLREVEDDDGSSGAARLRVAAFAVDEIGTEILRSEAVFSIGEDPTPSSAGAVEDIGIVAPAAGDIGRAGVGLGDTLALGALVLPSGAEPTALIAGWLEAAIGRRFGEDWRWGGRMALAYPDPAGAGAGDVLDAVAVVTGRDRLTGGALDWRLAVSVCRRGGGAVVVGDCGITTPSPRRL